MVLGNDLTGLVTVFCSEVCVVQVLVQVSGLLTIVERWEEVFAGSCLAVLWAKMH